MLTESAASGFVGALTAGTIGAATGATVGALVSGGIAFWGQAKTADNALALSIEQRVIDGLMFNIGRLIKAQGISTPNVAGKFDDVLGIMDGSGEPRRSADLDHRVQLSAKIILELRFLISNAKPV